MFNSIVYFTALRVMSKVSLCNCRHLRFILITTCLLLSMLISSFFCVSVSVRYDSMVMRDVIVGFVDTPNLQLLSSYNAIILEVYNIIPAIHTLIPQNVIEELEQNSDIAYITENSQIQAAGTINWDVNWSPAWNWPLSLINVTEAVWTEYTGKGVRIALLDSGIGPIDDVPFQVGYNFVDNSTDVTDRYGHGTLIASLISTQPTPAGFRGVAPDAQIYAVKVLDDNGVGSPSNAVLGIQWAIENNMQIISISWCNSERNSALEQALNVAYNSGILIVAAAGNTGEVAYGVGCPADYESTIAVTAIKENTRKLETACSGSEVELASPGENIYGIGADDKIYNGTGTSYATAYVTGVAALVWAKNPTLTNIQVRNILCQTATDLQPNDELNRNEYFGYGLINATAALQITSNLPTDTPTDTPTNAPASPSTSNKQQQTKPTLKTDPPTNNNQQITNSTINIQQATNPNSTSETNPSTNPVDITNIIITADIILIISTIIISLLAIRYNRNKNYS